MKDKSILISERIYSYFLSKNANNLRREYIAIIHSYKASVINADNKMITLARIGRIIGINQIIKRNANTTTNNL